MQEWFNWQSWKDCVPQGTASSNLALSANSKTILIPMKNTTCFFCSILKEEHCKLFESEFFYSHLSHVPVNPGHIELFPKRHLNKITDLKDIEWKTLKDTIQETTTLLQDFDFLTYYKNIIESFEVEYIKKYALIMCEYPYIQSKPTGFNFGINQGESAGQTVDHLHIHIIPRFEGDVEDPTGGVRNLMNNLGNYKKFK